MQVAGFDLLEELFHQVEGVEEDVHHGGLEGERAFAEAVEDVLEVVGQEAELFEAEEAGGAFDGVDGAEDFVDELTVVGGFFELEQVVLQVFEDFAGLDDEALDNLPHLLRKERLGQGLQSDGLLDVGSRRLRRSRCR